MSSLESEDIDSGPLVRMEDVQPARDRPCGVFAAEIKPGLETCIVDSLEYDNECVVDDDDSNIGSMVSIHSEEVADCDENSSGPLVPETVEPQRQLTFQIPIQQEVKSPPDSWPTLEILPGGVIKHSEKYDEDLSHVYKNTENDEDTESGEMMYACAKCSQSFKYLFCLVKHVRWHEKEQKKEKGPDLSKLKANTAHTVQVRKYICLHSGRRNILTKTKRKVPKKSKS